MSISGHISKNWEVRVVVCVDYVHITKPELCFEDFPSLYDSELELAQREIHRKGLKARSKVAM